MNRHGSPLAGQFGGASILEQADIGNPSGSLLRRQNHYDLASFGHRLGFDFGQFGGVFAHPLQEIVAKLLMRHLAPAKAKGDLYFVAFFEEARHRAHLDLVIVLVDAGPELDFLDLNRLLLFARFGGFLLLLEAILPVIHHLGDGWVVVRRNFDKIEPGVAGDCQGFYDGNGAAVGSGRIDQLNFADTDVFVGARAIFLHRRCGSHWAANGGFLLNR